MEEMWRELIENFEQTATLYRLTECSLWGMMEVIDENGQCFRWIFNRTAGVISCKTENLLN